MSLYQYEFKKVFKSKLCIVLFALLIGLNFLFGLVTYKNDTRDNQYSEHYADEINDIIYNAKMNYISIENKESENAQYQLEIIKRYSEIQSLDVSSDVRGYDMMLSSSIPYVSALLFAIIVSVLLSHQEHSANLILASFQHSRIKICFSKILLLFTVSFAGAVVFLGAQTVGGVIKSGFDFSGGMVPIQCIPAYMYCPYRISVIQAVFLRFLFAFLTVYILSLIVLLFGIIMHKAIWSLLFTVLLFGGDYLLMSIYSENIFSIFYQLNIKNFIADNWLFRYSGKKLFGFMSRIELFGLFAVLAIVLLIFLSVWRFRYLKFVQPVKSRSGSVIGKKQSIKSFLYYEAKKIWSIKTALAIVLLLIASLVMQNATIKVEERDLEKIYRYYIEQMSDLSYDEQVAFSFQMRISLNETINEASVIRDEYINGEATREKYVEAQQKAGVAELELDVLRVIDRQLNSIGELNKEGIQAKLIYSSGWKNLIQNSNHFFLLFAVVLLVVPYITFEKESSFHIILQGIFQGHKYEYRKFRVVKFLLAFVSSMVIVMLFYSSELLLVHSKYGLSDWMAYAAGADILFNHMELKIVEALLLRLLFSALGIVIVILLAEVLTVFLKKSIWTIILWSGIESLMYVISEVTNHSVFSIISYFGFELLYRHAGWIVMQTILFMIIPIGVMLGHFRIHKHVYLQ